MDSVDRLLATIKAEREVESQQGRQVNKPLQENHSLAEASGSQEGPAAFPAPSPLQVPTNLDELLGRLGETQKRSIRQNLSRQPPRSIPKWQPLNEHRVDSATQSNSFGASSLLADLKAQYQAQDAAIAAARQQAEIEAARQKEVRLREAQSIAMERAKEWLQRVSVDSEEGLWFEEFAHNYDSRLEAAIAYLGALSHS